MTGNALKANANDRRCKIYEASLSNILTYLRHRITNAMMEGFNSKIQSIKANARGYLNFLNYRIAILFYCGKLELHPRQAQESRKNHYAWIACGARRLCAIDPINGNHLVEPHATAD